MSNDALDWSPVGIAAILANLAKLIETFDRTMTEAERRALDSVIASLNAQIILKQNPAR